MGTLLLDYHDELEKRISDLEDEQMDLDHEDQELSEKKQEQLDKYKSQMDYFENNDRAKARLEQEREVRKETEALQNDVASMMNDLDLSSSSSKKKELLKAGYLKPGESITYYKGSPFNPNKSRPFVKVGESSVIVGDNMKNPINAMVTNKDGNSISGSLHMPMPDKTFIGPFMKLNTMAFFMPIGSSIPMNIPTVEIDIDSRLTKIKKIIKDTGKAIKESIPGLKGGK